MRKLKNLEHPEFNPNGIRSSAKEPPCRRLRYLWLCIEREIAMDELSIKTKEQVYRALGESVARIWSRLPQDIQHHLFEGAVASQGESARQQIAIFLHGRHPRTADSMKARAMPEPDSLGG